MNTKTKTILLTGASGFIGRNFIDKTKQYYQIYALARRSQTKARVSYHTNIKWILGDLGDQSKIEKTLLNLLKPGQIDFIIHLAGYYDFNYTANPEYERTNVNGTENILKLAKKLKIKRFIFASSLAGCEFSPNAEVVNENSPLNADFDYAISKKKGEDLVKEYSQWFPCSVIRLAAVFSDWCEYAPLYQFLSVWLGNHWNSRILGGRGESAMPYIHIYDVCNCIQILLEKTDELPKYRVYNVSPDGATSHLDLFQVSTRYYYGRSCKPIFIPKLLAYPGIILRKSLKKCHIGSQMCFENLWMLKYIDLKLNVSSQLTQQELSWSPTLRYHILRRMLFLLENYKRHSNQWRLFNGRTLERTTKRPNYIIYELMIDCSEKIINDLSQYIYLKKNDEIGCLNNLAQKELKILLSSIYHILLSAIRSGDRELMLNCFNDFASQLFKKGWNSKAMIVLLNLCNQFIVKELMNKNELIAREQDVYDFVSLSIQLAEDEIEDFYELYIGL